MTLDPLEEEESGKTHPPGSPPRAEWAVAGGIALATFLLHLVVIERYGIFRDELYYLACSERLTWGYVDHPPLSIAVLAAVRGLLGDSLAAIRLPAAAAHAAAVFLTSVITRELGGGRFAQALAAVAVAVAPVFLGSSHFFSMNALDLLFWALATLLLVRTLKASSRRGWLLLGVVVGLGLLNKISVLWFILGLGVGLLVTPHRKHLATPGPWLAAMAAGLLFLPHVLWQAQNGWPTR